MKVYLIMCLWICFGTILSSQQLYETEKYSISYPDSWTIDESGMMGTKFLIFSAVESAADNFRENVNLVVEDVSQYDIDLEQYIAASSTQITNMMTDAKILSTDKVGNHYVVVFEGVQGIYNLKFEQHVYMKDQKAYVLTFTAKDDDFDKYAETARGILKSFRL